MPSSGNHHPFDPQTNHVARVLELSGKDRKGDPVNFTPLTDQQIGRVNERVIERIARFGADGVRALASLSSSFMRAGQPENVAIISAFTLAVYEGECIH